MCTSISMGPCVACPGFWRAPAARGFFSELELGTTSIEALFGELERGMISVEALLCELELGMISVEAHCCELELGMISVMAFEFWVLLAPELGSRAWHPELSCGSSYWR